MKIPFTLLTCLVLTVGGVQAAETQTAKTNDTMQQRMQEALPYDVNQTIATFSKTVHGGIQHVVVKSKDNTEQITRIQKHLMQMTERLRKGDFSLTESLHGKDMPGLAQLKTAKPDDISYKYKALENGGQIHYSSEYPQYVGALHEWFDAQASEHGNSEIPGHSQHHSSPAE